MPDDPTDLPAASESTKGRSFGRKIVAVAIVLGFTGLFLYTGGWFDRSTLTPARMIDTFEKVNGPHPGFRRNHSKGIGFSWYFESNGAAASLSKASVFAPGRFSVLGRFALAGGQPFQKDAIHTVRSMAVRFALPGAEEWRTGMNDIPVFAVNSPQAFYEQLLASAPDPATGKPDPARMQAFLQKNPASAKAIQLIRNAPMSSGFENSTFNSLDAFLFIAPNGTSTAVRWSMVPEMLSAPTTNVVRESTDDHFLFDALIESVHEHPLRWHLIITVGQPGDPTSDATLPWPSERTRLDAGVLTVDHIESEETSPARDINFDPLILPSGIAASDDPLLSARSAAYSESFTRREAEARTTSALSTADVERK